MNATTRDSSIRRGLDEVRPNGLQRWAERIRREAVRFAEHRWAAAIVVALECVGCTVLPLPNALILVGMVTAAPRRWLHFALGATGGSMIGGMILYVIGRLFYDSVGAQLIATYGGPDRWNEVVTWFHSGWGIAFVMVAGMTTGFFRVAGLGAGFTAVDPVAFLLVLTTSRAIRWTAECAAIKYVGDRLRRWPRRYVRYAVAAAALIVLVAVIAVAL